MSQVGQAIQGAYNGVTGQTGGQTTAGSLAQNGYNPNAAQDQQQLNMNAYGPNQTTNANAAQIDQGQANQFLGGEQGLVAQLQAQAQGSGPSLAQQQLHQATQANLASQLAMAAGARGNQNAGAAQYALGQNAAAANQAAAGQSAATRANEQLSAEQGLGQVLGQYGGQQIGLAENQAGLNQQANLQNANAANQMAQFNTQSAQAGNQAQQQQAQFNAGQQNALTQQGNSYIGQGQLQSQQASGQFGTGVVGGLLNAAGGALGSLTGGGGAASAGLSGGGGSAAGGASAASDVPATDAGAAAAGGALVEGCPHCALAGGALCLGHAMAHGGSPKMAGGGMVGEDYELPPGSYTDKKGGLHLPGIPKGMTPTDPAVHADQLISQGRASDASGKMVDTTPLAGGGMINGMTPFNMDTAQGPETQQINFARSAANASAAANGGGALEPLPALGGGGVMDGKKVKGGPPPPKVLAAPPGGREVTIGDDGPEAVVPLNGKVDPHDFLDAMIAKLKVDQPDAHRELHAALSAKGE